MFHSAGTRRSDDVYCWSAASVKPWMPCCSGRFPVAIVVHRLGESVGVRVERWPNDPRSISARRFGHLPCARSGRRTFHSRPSAPTTRTRAAGALDRAHASDENARAASARWGRLFTRRRVASEHRAALRPELDGPHNGPVDSSSTRRITLPGRPCPCLAGATLLALAGCSRPPAIQNVVLISIDTLRADHVGIYGAERDLTPVLDELGTRGVVFDQAVAQAPWTIPSHATMLTSQYPSALGVGPFANPGKLSEAAVTLAEVFHEHGFATAAITGGYVSKDLGFDQGFDSFRETPDTPSMAYTVTYADEWLEKQDAARPFFLFLHTFEVHQYDPPAEFRRRWVRPYEGPLSGLDSVPAFVQSPANLERVRALGPEDWRYLRDRYDACLASVDSEIGRLLGILQARGLRERTLVVVTSDHGEEFGEHGGSGHGYTLYDENLRVPLLLSHPSLPALRVAEQVRLLDLAPTIAQLAGLPIPALWQGTSLVPLLSGSTLSLPAFAEHAHRPMKAVRKAGAKLVVEARGPRRLLFDLAGDPVERTSLAGAGSARERELCEALRRFVETNAAGERLIAVPDASADPALRGTLERLGYAGTDSEPDAGGREWLDLLRCEPSGSAR